MKIISLRVEAFKRLSAVYIEPSGALIPISGRNSQGKTSVLDAIWTALAGKSAIDPEPIRHGEQRARIRLDMGEIIVTRNFKVSDNAPDGYTTTLTIEAADGTRVREPQAMLDALVGDLTFDPLRFESAKPDDQFAMVRGLLPGVDFDGVEKANALDFETRAEVNRRAKDLETRAQAIHADMGAIGEKIDVDALLDRMQSASAHNSDIDAREHRRQQATESIAAMQREARDLVARAERVRAEADGLDAQALERVRRADEVEARLAAAEPLPERIDVSALRLEIDKAKATNAAVEARERRMALWKEAREAQAESERLTAAVDGRKTALRSAVAAAEFPVAGVTFEGRAVYLGGVPFEQASDAERLKASIQIAMALNPKLRVVRVRDGSRLDEDNLALLGELADKAGFQVWVERVGSDGKVGVVIEDGHVRGQDPAAILAAEEPAPKPKRGRSAMQRVGDEA